MRRLTIPLLILITSFFLTSCLDGIFGGGDDNGDSSGPTGTLAVTTQTSGSDKDSDGYEIILDGGAISKNVGVSETVYFTGLEEGTHRVVLDTSSVLSNCSLDGSRSKEVSVFEDDTTSTSFGLTCREVANNQIAFTSDRDGDREIYLMNADGSNPRQITDNTHYDALPVISNDGTKIAFLSDRGGSGSGEMYIMDVDGSNVQQVTSSPSSPQFYSWSPDDSKIAYTDPRSGNYEIYTIETDGSNRTRLTNDSALDMDPSWSEDGKIAFRSNRSGSQEIHTMDADGSNKQQITTNTGFIPRWSPDGDKIAFTSGRSGNLEIYVMNSDGTGLRQVTDDGDFDSFPTWSADGNSIAFQTDRDGNNEIYKINADGTGSVINLTVNPNSDSAPHWSPVE